ncbi:helix-turn-helix domain-containing protein [Parabacteroides distasonis]|nr:helix-turn-helix domain-containing protein [Parabacteroides distasonis]
MYIENYDFKEWMQKLFDKLDELCKDIRALHTADKVLPEDDNLLDNQDLCLLFKVSIKTLQRYRAIGVLPYFTLSGKVYYRASDVRAFIKERFNAVTLRKFEKEHCAKRRSETDKPEWWVSTAPALCSL